MAEREEGSEESPPEVEIPEAVVETARRARRVVAVTGAGVSAESGVPTFRDAMTGLWARFRAEDLATPEAFARDPATVWAWYVWRRRLLEGVRPNPAHEALAEMSSLYPEFALVTQNVDGLHQRAGSTDVIELHGNLARDRCEVECGSWPGRTDEEGPPPCPACGRRLRPDVVWFGELLPSGALMTAFEAAEQCDLLLSIGTSGLVEPAASIPRVAHASGATVVVVNPEPSGPPGERMIHLRGPAGIVLPALLTRIREG